MQMGEFGTGTWWWLPCVVDSGNMAFWYVAAMSWFYSHLYNLSCLFRLDFWLLTKSYARRFEDRYRKSTGIWCWWRRWLEKHWVAAASRPPLRPRTFQKDRPLLLLVSAIHRPRLCPNRLGCPSPVWQQRFLIERHRFGPCYKCLWSGVSQSTGKGLGLVRKNDRGRVTAAISPRSRRVRFRIRGISDDWLDRLNVPDRSWSRLFNYYFGFGRPLDVALARFSSNGIATYPHFWKAIWV